MTRLDPPQVSVVICTRDRPAAFRRALASVLAQDSSDFEIIVVDGSDPPVDLPAIAGATVTLLRDERDGEGRARAAGLRAARGDLVAWCDDDAEWTADHLRLLRDALLGTPGAALAHAHSSPPAKAPAPDAPQPSFIRASDVLLRADAARNVGGFDHHLRAFAAGDLWTRMVERAPSVAIPAVLTRHHPATPVATPSEREQASERLRADWETNERRRAAMRARLARRAGQIVPFDPTTWTRQRRLIFQTILNGPQSFPVVARALIAELRARGVRVTIDPLHDNPAVDNGRGIFRSLGRQDALGLVYDFRTGPAELDAERVVALAMWETTVMPAWQVEEINAAATLLYVPCRESARIARANGIVPPARVLHHGVDPRRFPYLERPRRGEAPFTFGSNGVLSIRKGIDILMRAFSEEFAPDEPVRLSLRHAYTPYRGEEPRDPRITLTHGYATIDGLLDFLRDLDAYVLPSRGEGFGLTGLEAMATGLPVIATNWSGPAEYLDPSDTFPLRYRLEESGGAVFQNRRHFGLWAEPDVDHLRALLRYVFEHRAEAAEMGRHASVRVHRDWTWGRVAEQLIADFDLLAAGVSPAATY